MLPLYWHLQTVRLIFYDKDEKGPVSQHFQLFVSWRTKKNPHHRSKRVGDVECSGVQPFLGLFVLFGVFKYFFSVFKLGSTQEFWRCQQNFVQDCLQKTQQTQLFNHNYEIYQGVWFSHFRPFSSGGFRGKQNSQVTLESVSEALKTSHF